MCPTLAQVSRTDSPTILYPAAGLKPSIGEQETIDPVVRLEQQLSGLRPSQRPSAEDVLPYAGVKQPKAVQHAVGGWHRQVKWGPQPPSSLANFILLQM